MPSLRHLLAVLPGAAGTWVHRAADRALLRTTRPATSPTTEEARQPHARWSLLPLLIVAAGVGAVIAAVGWLGR